MATFKVEDIIHSFSSNFPYCLDTNVLGSCRGLVKEYGAGCWIRGCVGDSCWIDERGEPFQGLGIYQPTAEEVLLSRNGNVAILLEQKGTGNRYSGFHFFTTEESKFVHRSFTKRGLLGGALYAGLAGGTPTVYGLVVEGEEPPSHPEVQGFTFKPIMSAGRGWPHNEVLYASEGVLSKGESGGIIRYKIVNETIVGESRHGSTWLSVRNGGNVVFAQSQTRGHGALAVSGDTFQYLGVNKTYDEGGNLIDVEFQPPDNRTVDGCTGIEAIAFLDATRFLELESKANRVHVICRSNNSLSLFEYDLDFPNATREIKSFAHDEAATFRFSADGSTLVFNYGSKLKVYSNQTRWYAQVVQPVHKRNIDRFAISGDGTTIVTTSTSHVPQLFRVIPLRCSSPERPMELLISAKVLFFMKPLTVRWSFKSGSERLVMGSMNFTTALEDEARLCLPSKPGLSQMWIESLPLSRLPFGAQPSVHENRFSFSVTLNARLCCSGYVDDFGKTECDFKRCISDQQTTTTSPSSWAPTIQPDPSGTLTIPPTSLPTQSPSLASAPDPTLAPSKFPTLSVHPTVRGATSSPTYGPSHEPSLFPTPPPSGTSTSSPTLGTVPPSELSSIVACLWPNLAQCGETFTSNNLEEGLQGPIPTTIGLWSQLTDLSLSANTLSGTIPSEIGMLVNLRSLSVFGNNLHGTIPTEIGRLTQLTQLWLDNNQFTGKIPSELGLLKSIRKIDVQFNDCTGTVPSELGRPQTLQGINLFGNSLSGTIPREICDHVTDKVLIDCDKVLCQPGCCRGRFGTTQC